MHGSTPIAIGTDVYATLRNAKQLGRVVGFVAGDTSAWPTRQDAYVVRLESSRLWVELPADRVKPIDVCQTCWRSQ